MAWLRARVGRRRMTSAARATLVTALALMLALALPAPAVQAHAAFDRATPAPGSSTTSAPPDVTIWFSEPVTRSLSAIEVFDATRQRIDRNDLTVDGARMTVTLRGGLAAGVYTVSWRNVSEVDGHALQGSYVFGVGDVAVGGALLAAPGALEPPLLASRGEPFVRFLVVLGGVLALGALLFGPAAGIPALAALSERDARRLSEALMQPLGRIVVGGAAVFLLASGAQLVVHAASATFAPGTDQLTELKTVVDSAWGRRWVWRVALGSTALAAFSALSMISGWLEDRHPAVRSLHWMTGATLAGALLTVSLTSHGAAVSGLAVPGTLADALHLAAAAAWSGGLVALWLALRAAARVLSAHDQRAYVAELVPRFSTIALLSVATLTLSGAYATWLQVTALRAFSTPYGVVLLAKLGLTALLLALGAVNLWWLRPRLRHNLAAAASLRRSVAAEIVLVVLVIAAAGLLTSIEPARQVQTREELARGLVVEHRADGVRTRAALQPGAAGANRVTVALDDERSGPIRAATNVRVRVQPADTDVTATPQTARALGDGRYVVDAMQLPSAGVWQITVEATRPDGLDVHTRLEAALPARAPDSSTAGIAPDPDRGRLLWAGVVAALGLTVLAVLPFAWRWRAARARATTLGATLALAGVVLFYGAQAQEDAPAAQRNNPVPFSTASIADGRELFAARCAECHGATGRGDGPRAASLTPPPAALSVHVPLHLEGQLFTFIARGVAGTAMPAFQGELRDEQIWALVNYLQTLGQPSVER
ncbi:MAG: c-type cytochrome [Dehalococcoidia bacterium]|nr:c-type cytochrome [Dehalococcoidia bacterium]